MGLTWVLYILAGVLGIIGLWLLFRALLADRSRGRRRCPKCWYDMSGVPGLTCPECGRVAKSEWELLRTRRHFRRYGAAILLLFASFVAFCSLEVIRNGWRASVPLWGVLLVMEVYDTPSSALRDLAYERATQSIGSQNTGSTSASLDPFSKRLLARAGLRLFLKPGSDEFGISREQTYAIMFIHAAAEQGACISEDLAKAVSLDRWTAYYAVRALHLLPCAPSARARDILRESYSRGVPRSCICDMRNLLDKLGISPSSTPGPVLALAVNGRALSYMPDCTGPGGFVTNADCRRELLRFAAPLAVDDLISIEQEFSVDHFASLLAGCGPDAQAVLDSRLSRMNLPTLTSAIQQIGGQGYAARWTSPMVVKHASRFDDTLLQHSALGTLRWTGASGDSEVAFCLDVIRRSSHNPWLQGSAIQALWSVDRAGPTARDTAERLGQSDDQYLRDTVSTLLTTSAPPPPPTSTH